VGIRESAISFGAVAGPLLATFASQWLIPQGIFALATITTLTAVMLVLFVLKPQDAAHAPARADVPKGMGERIYPNIPIEHIMARLAHVVHEAYVELSEVTHGVLCALQRALSLLVSQGGYNEENKTDPIERMAA
jgi:hypothetical protein